MGFEAVIYSLLTTGAALVSSGVVAEFSKGAGKDAYDSLKAHLMASHQVASLASVDQVVGKDTCEASIRSDLEQPGIVSDPEVKRLAKDLLRAIEALDPTVKARYAVDIRAIEAHRNLIFDDVQGVHADNVTSGQDITFKKVVAPPGKIGRDAGSTIPIALSISGIYNAGRDINLHLAGDPLISSFKTALEQLMQFVVDAQSAYEAGFKLVDNDAFDVRISVLLLSSYLLRETGEFELSNALISHSELIIKSDQAYVQIYEGLINEGLVSPISALAWKRIIWLHARLLSVKSTMYADQDKLDLAEVTALASRRLSSFVGDVEHATEISVNLADLKRRRGDTAAARKMLEAAIISSETRGQKKTTACALCSLSHIQVAAQEYEGAALSLTRAVQIADAIDEKLFAAILKGDLANVYLFQNEIDKSIREINAALETVEARGHRRCISYFRGTRGDILFRQGNTGEALNDYLKSLSVSESPHNAHCAAKACLRLHYFYKAVGKNDESIQILRRGINESKAHDDVGLKRELERCLI